MKPTDLRGILQYIPRFREKTFVIAADGAVVTHANFANLLLDIAVLRSLNIRVVLVHGAARHIASLAEEQSVSPSNLDGTGITDDTTLKLALTAANGLTHEILEGFATNNLRAANANAVVAFPMGILDGVDHLHTGKVSRVDGELLQSLLAQDITPVIPPLGFDGEGNTFRLNSDAVALAISQNLKATKLIFISTENGLSTNGRMIRQMISSKLEALLTENPESIPAAQRSKARHAAEACATGVPRVQLINGLVTEGLLAEVFSNEGIGTLIYASEYRQIRPAQQADVGSILRLSREAMDGQQLLERTEAAIEGELESYYIYEIDGNPVACVSLREFGDVGELAHLYVNPAHSNMGIGKKLLQFIEDTARDRGMTTLIALSTRAFSFFQSKAGYREGLSTDLPEARAAEYKEQARNSKVLIKALTH